MPDTGCSRVSPVSIYLSDAAAGALCGAALRNFWPCLRMPAPASMRRLNLAPISAIRWHFLARVGVTLACPVLPILQIPEPALGVTLT